MHNDLINWFKTGLKQQTTGFEHGITTFDNYNIIFVCQIDYFGSNFFIVVNQQKYI